MEIYHMGYWQNRNITSCYPLAIVPWCPVVGEAGGFSRISISALREGFWFTLLNYIEVHCTKVSKGSHWFLLLVVCGCWCWYCCGCCYWV